MIRVDSGYQFPNGVAIRHMNDGRPYQLIVAETPTKKLWSYDIKGPAKVENKKVWGNIPGKCFILVSNSSFSISE